MWKIVSGDDIIVDFESSTLQTSFLVNYEKLKATTKSGARIYNQGIRFNVSARIRGDSPGVIGSSYNYAAFCSATELWLSYCFGSRKGALQYRWGSGSRQFRYSSGEK